MGFELISFSSGFLQKNAVNEVLSCNEYSEAFGLVLTESQAVELVETRAFALRQCGRIEFGGGVLDKLIKAFCDSPYVSPQDYAETLHELTELFYFYKNETMDQISDDDLISFMKTSFDGVCRGSLELLSGRELYQLARNVRFGCSENDSDDNLFKTDQEDEGEDDE